MAGRQFGNQPHASGLSHSAPSTDVVLDLRQRWRWDFSARWPRKSNRKVLNGGWGGALNLSMALSSGCQCGPSSSLDAGQQCRFRLYPGSACAVWLRGVGMPSESAVTVISSLTILLGSTHSPQPFWCLMKQDPLTLENGHAISLDEIICKNTTPQNVDLCTQREG